MYEDKTLLPREVIRLAALGFLAGRRMSYAALANDVRHFISHITGPSLDLMGTSIELLRYEGLIEPLDAETVAEDTIMDITAAGRRELHELLRSAVRAPLNDINKLVLALKMHFLHLLDESDRLSQAEMMIEACGTELARLVDLRTRYADTEGYLEAWLDNDIDLNERRLDWLKDFRRRLEADRDKAADRKSATGS